MRIQTFKVVCCSCGELLRFKVAIIDAHTVHKPIKPIIIDRAIDDAKLLRSDGVCESCYNMAKSRYMHGLA